MIKEISLDFGPFYEETIQLGPFVVVTSDSPDRGKSHLVVRALQWCLFNEGYYSDDDTKDEIRHQSSDGKKARHARVQVTFDDGRWVERYRGPGKNAYRIFDGATTQEYLTVGQGFFQKISDVFHIQPPKLDGKNPECANIFGYFDEPFLLSRSPAQIDTILSRLMGSDIWEDASALVAADLRKAQQAAKAAGEQIASVETALGAYAGVDKGFALLEQAEALLAAKQACSEQSVKILKLSTRHEDTAASIGQLSFKIDKLSPLMQNAATALEQSEKLREQMVEAGKQVVLFVRSEEIQKDVEALEEEINGLEIRISAAGRIIEQVEQQAQQTDKLTAEMNRCKQIVRSAEGVLMLINDIGVQIETLEKSVEAERVEFEQALEDAGVCPLCGSEINHSGGTCG